MMAGRRRAGDRTPHRLAAAGLALSLGACASVPEPDGPPRDSPLDLASISEPQPRAEPRSRYGNPESYVVNGRRYEVMNEAEGYVERGTASWYGRKFHGRRTSSGEPYDMYELTAAHRTLPLPTYARVTNLRNDRSIVVRINDRGPFRAGRLIDLSYAAAAKLGIVAAGTAPVEVRALHPDDEQAGDTSTTTAPADSTDAAEAPQTRVFRNAGADVFLQVGAFTDEPNAQRLRARLREADVAPVRIEPSRHRHPPLFRVRVGPLDSVDAAERLAQRLAGLGVARSYVVID